MYPIFGIDDISTRQLPSNANKREPTIPPVVIQNFIQFPNVQTEVAEPSGHSQNEHLVALVTKLLGNTADIIKNLNIGFYWVSKCLGP